MCTVRLPTSPGADAVHKGVSRSDLPCSCSVFCRPLISFSSESAALSVSCAGRAADHAWKSRMSSKSMLFNSVGSHHTVSDGDPQIVRITVAYTHYARILRLFSTRRQTVRPPWRVGRKEGKLLRELRIVDDLTLQIRMIHY